MSVKSSYLNLIMSNIFTFQSENSNNHLPCTVCGALYPDAMSLQEHWLTHVTKRPYVCKICDAGFTTAEALSNHSSSHISSTLPEQAATTQAQTQVSSLINGFGFRKVLNLFSGRRKFYIIPYQLASVLFSTVQYC